ncbi:MAG: hypothetical protein ACI8QS_001405 [Planctomycetota bacterium]|jgi:hypothetical protein
MRTTPLGLLLTAPALLAAAAVPAAFRDETVSGGDAGVVVDAGSGSVEAPTMSAAAMLQRAFWLEEHEGELAEAMEIYEEVASNRGFASKPRGEASRRVLALGQDLIAGDLAQLLPPEAIAYAELSEPGSSIAGLLEQLGLSGRVPETGEFGISPELVGALVGLRGAAVAITAMNDRGFPSGVIVLHPGDMEVTRGMLEGAISANGQVREPIEGYPTWAMPIEMGLEVYITMTERLFIASNDSYEIGAVIERMWGDDDDNLANDENLTNALAGRHGALVSVCINAGPVMPMIKAIAGQAMGGGSQSSMALALLDLGSLRTLSGHLTASEEGLGLNVELGLADDHRNLVFDLFRHPNVRTETLALVPEGAAFAMATAINPKSRVAPLDQNSAGRPMISMLDIGREVFANVIDLAVFGMPAEDMESQLPEVGLVLRVNDPERTLAVLDLVFGLVTQAGSGAGQQVGHEVIAGVETSRYSIEGMPLYVASEAGRVIVSPSWGVIARSIDAAGGHGSLLDDSVFRDELANIDESASLMLLAAPGRLASMLTPFAPTQERENLAAVADLMGSSMLAAKLIHGDTRLGLQVRLGSLPDVSDLVVRALRGEEPLLRTAAVAAPSEPSFVADASSN